jgi:HSP20 family protein
VEVRAELPGIDEKDIDVRLSDGTLTIRGEKKEEREEREEGGSYYVSERRYGSFQRSFRIPEGIDHDKVDASFRKGVLTITLPKTPEAQQKAKKIEVKGEK